MARIEDGANVPTYSGEPLILVVTDVEEEWMQRQHERKLIENAQRRVARGFHRGSRRTQLDLGVFAEIVALAEVGAQTRKEWRA